MIELITLIWLHLLYGLDPLKFTSPPASKDWDRDAVYNVTTVVINANEDVGWNYRKDQMIDVSESELFDLPSSTHNTRDKNH